MRYNHPSELEVFVGLANVNERQSDNISVGTGRPSFMEQHSTIGKYYAPTAAA